MYLQSIKTLKPSDKILVKCEDCGSDRIIKLQTAKNISRLNDCHLCRSCKSKKTIKPQNTKEYWTDIKKEDHGKLISNDNTFKTSIKNRDNSGEKNGMFGKKMSKESIDKMSVSRIGKTGENSTAWKGGKVSVVRCVKSICHTRFNWYFRVYQRDNFCCQKCGSKKIEAHHKDPIFNIIKELCKDKVFESKHEQIEWLVNQPRIKDEFLLNGITLCRNCHKEAHVKWGSHKPNVK